MKKTTLYSEIHEQPKVIQTLIDHENRSIQKIVLAIQGKYDYVLIAARGTSDNTARYAQYLLGIENNLQVALATPSLFSIYKSKPDLRRALVIGISQSGQSPDIVSVLAEGRAQGCPTISITNYSDSPLAKTSDFVINLHAGVEKAVAATKTYTASLAAISLFSSCLDNNQHRYRELCGLPDIITKSLPIFEKQLEMAVRYRYIDRCIILGRGLNYSTSFEIALKIKELTGIVTESYSTADFLHGPIATVSKGFPVFLVAPKGCMLEDLKQMQTTLLERNAEIIAISNDREVLKNSRCSFPLPGGLPEWISPIVAVVPGQLFALMLAYEKGLDPDHPLGLTKVTQTL